MQSPESNQSVQADTAAIEAMVRESGSSFLAAMRLMSEEKRHAMFALYAFCREVDDIADDAAPLQEKHQKLANWRIELDRLFEGAPKTVIGSALLAPIGRCSLEKKDFLAVIDGMEFDAAPKIRVADGAELDLYCDRVAGAVGRMSSRVFGLVPDKGNDLSASLGRALQLTNILRDLKEDAGRDRLYLPADMLAEHGIADTENLDRVFADAAFPRVCEAVVTQALGYYDAADGVIATCPRKNVRPAVIMKEIYRRILDRLIARGWQPSALDRGVGLSKAAKVWVVLRHGVI